ncbi:MAG: tetratricopeptide repeat protein [Gallionella sp.]|nr:tetratricopeptide repeat protein [Gallionella sp.]
MHKHLSHYLCCLIAVLFIATGALASEDIGDELRNLEQLPIAELEKAADAGNANAQLLLGYEYFTGNRLDRNYQKALTYYQDSAKNGSHAAMSTICNMYLYGYGVEKDYTVAFQWCKDAARAGNRSAMVMLAEIVTAKDGPMRDKPESYRNQVAFQFYEMGATRGHMHGQYMLGWCYENGVGVEKDTHQALVWYNKSAEQGYEKAINAAKHLRY